MALVYIDSFDHYNGTYGGAKWTTTFGTLSTTTGRFGSGLALAGGSGAAIKKDNLVTSGQTAIVGLAVYPTTVASDRTFLLYICSNGNPQNIVQIPGSTYPNISHASGTLTSSKPIVVNAWNYIEVKVVYATSGGTVEIRVNEESGGTFTGNTGNYTWNGIWIGGQPSQGSVQGVVDDVYACDGSGSTNNNFLGDIRVEAIFPNANGTTSQLVGSDSNSTDNYLLVDETVPSTSDYVESSTPGDKDTYNYGSLTSATGTVYGVQIIPYAAKTDAGTRSIVSVARLSGTEVDGPSRTLSTTALYLPDIRETKPGGGAWSISDIASAEFGVKINE